MKTRRVNPCSVGGFNRRTGKSGTRHRWKESTDGRCIHCHKLRAEVIGEKPADKVTERLTKMRFET